MLALPYKRRGVVCTEANLRPLSDVASAHVGVVLGARTQLLDRMLLDLITVVFSVDADIFLDDVVRRDGSGLAQIDKSLILIEAITVGEIAYVAVIFALGGKLDALEHAAYILFISE